MDIENLLAARLHAIARAIERIERFDAWDPTLTPEQTLTLRILRDAPNASTSGLAAALGVHLSTATRNLSVLARRGYVVREASERDRRRIVHRLTRMGARTAETRRDDHRRALGAVWWRIPRRQQAVVLGALRVLADALNAQPDSDDPDS